MEEGGTREISVPAAPFCNEPTTTLKNKVFFFKRESYWLTQLRSTVSGEAPGMVRFGGSVISS